MPKSSDKQRNKKKVYRLSFTNLDLVEVLDSIPFQVRGVWVEALLCKALSISHPIADKLFAQTAKEKEETNMNVEKLKNIF